MGAHSIQPPPGSIPKGLAWAEDEPNDLFTSSTGVRCLNHLCGHLSDLHRVARRCNSRLFSARCFTVERGNKAAFRIIAEFTTEESSAEGERPYFALGTNPDGSAEYTDLRFPETDVLGQREY